MEGFVLEMPPLEEELKVVIIITSANTIIGSMQVIFSRKFVSLFRYLDKDILYCVLISFCDANDNK